MEDDAAEGSWVGLPEAIESLRADLAQAWLDGQGRRVRFRVEPVELTVQVALTRTDQWHRWGQMVCADIWRGKDLGNGHDPNAEVPPDACAI